MQIKVTIRSAYGQERVYPACDHARLLARLAGTTTLTQQHLVYIAALGYTIECYTVTGTWLQSIGLQSKGELH